MHVIMTLSLSKVSKHGNHKCVEKNAGSLNTVLSSITWNTVCEY